MLEIFSLNTLKIDDWTSRNDGVGGLFHWFDSTAPSDSSGIIVALRESEKSPVIILKPMILNLIKYVTFRKILAINQRK